MKEKFCVSKTIAYLVVLVLVVVGAMYVMNYANSQKVGSEPKAGWNVACAPYVSTSNGKIIKKVGDLCYGYTGYSTSATIAAGVYYGQNKTGTKIDTNGCYMKVVPCQMDVMGQAKISTKPVGSTVTCTLDKRVWAVPSSSGEGVSATGSTRGTGSNQYYAYNQVCARQTGRYVKIYKYNGDGQTFKVDYRCELSKDNVTEVDCRNSISVPESTGNAAVNKNPVVDDTNRADLSADNKLKLDFEEACPKNSKIWLSVLRINPYADVRTLTTVTSLRQNAALKWGDWDQCMKLTGKATVVKNPGTGATTYKCEAVTVSGGTWPYGGCQQ